MAYTKEELMNRAKTVSGPNMLHTKNKDYIFNRVLYVEDYFKFFDKVEDDNGRATSNLLNEKIAEYYHCDTNTIERYNQKLIEGRDRKGPGDKTLLAYLKAIQNVEAFNPEKHTYIKETEITNENLDGKIHPEIEDQLTFDIVKLSDEQKNKFIRNQMVSLLNKLESSRFFYYEPDVFPRKDGREYFRKKVDKIYSTIDLCYATYTEMNKKWKDIFRQIEDMTNMCAYPGISDKRWIAANETIIYFDVVFDFFEENSFLYRAVKNGKYENVHFVVDIDKDMIARRKKFLNEMHREAAEKNEPYSEYRILEREMIKALDKLEREL